MSIAIAFPLKKTEITPKYPLAICSGNTVHILYPNGDVESTTVEEIEHHPIKNSLGNCLVWGYLEEI